MNDDTERRERYKKIAENCPEWMKLGAAAMGKPLAEVLMEKEDERTRAPAIIIDADLLLKQLNVPAGEACEQKHTRSIIVSFNSMEEMQHALKLGVCKLRTATANNEGRKL